MYSNGGRISYLSLCFVQDEFRETALGAAVDQGHLHIAEILVENGADVNYRNKVRALIPVTQVCIMWPMIRHGIMVDQWDVNNKHAICTVHSRHAYVVVPSLHTNKILTLNLCPSHRFRFLIVKLHDKSNRIALIINLRYIHCQR